MSNAVSDPVPTDAGRVPIRLSRFSWIGLAAVILIVAGVGLGFGIPAWRQSATIQDMERVEVTLNRH